MDRIFYRPIFARMELRLICVLICVLAGIAPAQSQTADRAPRIALVIANGHYSHPNDRLSGPLRDAQTIRNALEQVGFTVSLVQNLDQRTLKNEIRSFMDRVALAGPNAIAFLYYAGHGGSPLGGKDNYLLPVDIPDLASADIAARGVPLRSIVEEAKSMDPRRAFAIVIDACRTPSGVLPSKSSAHANLGVVDLDEPSAGLVIAFSTSSGRPASDDGDYAKRLAAQIVRQGLTIGQVFEEVRIEFRNNPNAQFPVEKSGINERVCLASCTGESNADALVVLRSILETRPIGDLGQVRAISQLVREGKSLAGLDLSGVFLQGAALNGADLARANLQITNLENSSLEGANLTAGKLAFARLDGVKLRGGTANEALFYFVNAERADFEQIQGSRSNWHGAALRGAIFRGANLEGANFRMADLRNADFRGAKLQGAFFMGALVEGAKFDTAKLSNTDFGAAIGSADQFSPEQQSEICGSGVYLNMHRNLQVKLVKVSKSAALPSGQHFADVFSRSVPLRSGFQYLRPCSLRTTLPAGIAPVWASARTGETMTESFEIRLPQELLAAADRQSDVVLRLRTSIDSAVSSSQTAKHIVVFDKPQQDLLQTLNRNVGNYRLESKPWLDRDSVLLYMVRFQIDALTDATWEREARNWADRAGRGDSRHREGSNEWPEFFPKSSGPTPLSTQHIEVFRRWTVNRAKDFPTVVYLNLGRVERAKREKRRPLSEKANRLTDATVFPLIAFARRSTSINITNPSSLPSDLPAKNLLTAHGALIHLPKPIDSYAIALGAETVAPLSSAKSFYVAKLELGKFRMHMGLPVLQADKVSLHVQSVDGDLLP